MGGTEIDEGSVEDGVDAEAGRGADWLDWKQTTVDGRAAEYGEAGTGSPAVFLHGWGLDHKVYKRALSRLVRAGLHVHAPALPGFGGTAALPGPRPPPSRVTGTGWPHSSTRSVSPIRCW